ncbi:PREDICTED: M-phase inducer phosphatase isoform X1 [Polistes dominula]|uniref:protein-tyrosine-phosphatase n=2 Tax=Polistes dominula TaxID=743375 RepID=A0ABM1IM21_POLDO|nr:PREDICTED: M-phase inducer phosphatase isoform X1 [Polistes dominula]XP_015181259.1 PREDICTED: M-phase inducer phosphatase isoform X1 [Polistes dominula]XP_015181260.1 PREDICTED: M-phase inducer phosphatase isoform X1 [Polistes dominula]
MSYVRQVVPLRKITEDEDNLSQKHEDLSLKSLEIVSPVTNIIRDFNKSTISSPEDDSNNLDPCLGASKVLPQVVKEESLFKNVFRIRGTPEKELTPKQKGRRLVGMAARRIISLDTISPSTNKENGTINRNVIASPQKTTVSKKSRFPLEDCDPNNQDKEYGNTNLLERDNRTGFQFAEPLGVAPRRMSVDQRSPMQSPIRSSPHGLVTDPMIFRSLSSGYESMDDDLNDLMDLDALDEATHLPNGLTSLLSGSIVGSEIMKYAIITTPEYPRTKVKRSFRRSLSLQNDRTSPQSSISKVRSCLFRSPSTTCSTRKLSFDENVQSRTQSYSSIMDSSSNQPVRSYKRSEPPASLSPRLSKRSRISIDFQHIPENVELEISSNQKASYVTDIETKLVKKSNLSIEDITDEVDFCNVSMKESFDDKFEDSQAHALIKSAIHRSVTDADLTGDFSKPCILPLAEGRHDDLKSISVDTLAALMRGDFKQYIDSFVIVDCRYPYEFDGGHIEGALNLYSKELIEQHLLDPLTNIPEIQPNSIKRRILVFHCEFSWERGPNLSRFLRNIDRQRNKEHYPALHYPEVYLLHGGYEQFYKEQRNLCVPQGYKPMSDPNHEADLKQFRVKSKSWQGEKPVSRLNSLVVRTNIKRLGF